MSAFPTQLLMLGGTLLLLVYQLIVFTGFWVLARVLWRSGLRRYQGASSRVSGKRSWVGSCPEKLKPQINTDEHG